VTLSRFDDLGGSTGLARTAHTDKRSAVVLVSSATPPPQSSSLCSCLSMMKPRPRRSFPAPLWILRLRDAGHSDAHTQARAAHCSRAGNFEDRALERVSLLRRADQPYGTGVASLCKQPGAVPFVFAARAAVARAPEAQAVSAIARRVGARMEAMLRPPPSAAPFPPLGKARRPPLPRRRYLPTAAEATATARTCACASAASAA